MGNIFSSSIKKIKRQLTQTSDTKNKTMYWGFKGFIHNLCPPLLNSLKMLLTEIQ